MKKKNDLEKDGNFSNKILYGNDKKTVRLEDDFEIEIRKRDKKYFLGNAHSHNYYEMYYLVSGEIKYFIGDSIYLVKKGDVVLIPPHVIHKTVPGEDYEHTRILMTIMPNYLEEFLKYDPNLFDFFNSFIIPSTHRTTGRIENILQSLIAEYVEGYDKIMVKSLLGELFTILKRNTDLDSKRKEDLQIHRDSCSNRILAVVRYINKMYQTDIGLEDLAQEFDGRVLIGKYDVDEGGDMAADYGVRNIPTLLFFKDGELVDKVVGALPKPVLEAKLALIK